MRPDALPSADSETILKRMTVIERLYSLIVAVNWFASILPAAVIVLYTESRGLSLADIGLYAAVYSATAALLELPTGHLADTLGRKNLTLWGFGLAAVAKLLLLLAGSLPVFLASAVVSGLARALGSGALEAWFINSLRDLDPKVELQPRLARVNTLELLALGTGTVIGGLLPNLFVYVFPALAEIFTPLAATVIASLFFHLIALMLAALVIHEAQPARVSVFAALREGVLGLPSALREVKQLLKRSALLLKLLMLEGLIGVMLAASETYWQPFFARRFNLTDSSASVFGVIFAGCFLAGMLANLCAGSALRWLKGRTDYFGAISQAVQAVALLALAWQSNFWVAVGLFWMSYFARTIFSSSFLSLYNTCVPDSRRSLMLSALSVAMFAGFTVGNLGLGFISAATSIGWAWTGVAAVLLLSLGIFSRLRATDLSATTSSNAVLHEQ